MTVVYSLLLPQGEMHTTEVVWVEARNAFDVCLLVLWSCENYGLVAGWRRRGARPWVPDVARTGSPPQGSTGDQILHHLNGERAQALTSVYPPRIRAWAVP